MQFSLPFIDIIIFAIIAVFLIYRLKNILGEKTGYDPADDERKKYKQEKNVSNVIDLVKNKKANTINEKIALIINLDNNFSPNEFLDGAKIFFGMVVKSFVDGNLEDIKNYVKSTLIDNFQTAISERLKEKETLIIDIIKIQNTEIKDVSIRDSVINIQVLFESKQIKALKDKNNKVIDGNMKKEILVRDLWKFERDIKSSDKNWTLIETTVA